MTPTVYLVTGSAQGIGLPLVKEFASRSDVIVFAGVRTLPLKPESKLYQLVTQLPQTVFPILVTAADEADKAAAAEIVKAKTGKLDVLIANTGSTVGPNPIPSLTPGSLSTDFKVNTIGPIVLFNAFSSLLLASNKELIATAKFIVMSTGISSITIAYPLPLNSYGATKAAMNYLTKKIDVEYPNLIAFPIHPGSVDTGGARDVMGKLGMTPEQLGTITTKESAIGVLAVIDKATKETHGGKFFDNLGAELSY